MKIEKIKSIFKSKIKTNILAFFIFVSFLFLFFPLFRSEWVIVFWDIDIWFYTDNYIKRILPLWNEIWSTSNFFNSTRIFYVSFVSVISFIFSFDSSSFQKLMIFTFLFLSFFGMYLFVKQILTFEKFRKNLVLPAYFIFIISIISALFYAFNPWSIIRIQHIFLLAWYALLPFIFLSIIFITNFERLYRYKIPFYYIVMIAVLYVISIWSIHYLIFIFLFIFSRYIYNFFIFLLNKKYDKLLRFNYFFILLGIIIAWLISYFTIPYILSNTIYEISPKNLNTIETINLFSRFSSIDKILYLTSYWWTMIDFSSFWLWYKIGWFLIITTVFLPNLFNLKNKYVSFFLVWSIVLLILSSWTYYWLAPFYKWLIFDAPIISKVGFILRDPNKFVWLLAFCYSVLWGLGLAYFLSSLFKIRRKIENEKNLIDTSKNLNLWKVKNRYFLLSKSVYIFAVFFILISIISYSFYIKPFKLVFIDNFYSPVKIPDNYIELIEYQKKDEGKWKYIYMPRYESKMSPWYDFSIAKWNTKKYENSYQKAMWSIDINSSIKPTYHPLEGSINYLSMFYNYIDSYLTMWIWKNLHKYLYLLNIDKLVYHSDILFLEKEQKIQLENIKKQDNIKLDKNFWFIDVFDVEQKSDYINVYGNNLFHFWWFNNLETIFSLPGYNYKKFANIFVQQDTKINNWSKYEKQSDLINVKNKQDLFTSYLEDDEILAPFDYNNYYSPFDRWSIMRTDMKDFRWHLKHLWIKNWGWDFDLNKWFIFTYSPTSIDIEPYEDIYDKWKDIINFWEIKDISQLLKPDSKLINISIEKTKKYDSLPSIKWEIWKWDSKTWRVWIMKNIEVKEANPYFFELLVSGKWVNNIHGKIHFLDGELNEIWNSYVSAPKNSENFKAIKFRWNFITPINTRYISFKILSLENPKQDTYWWIHDIKLNDLEEYKKDNIQKLEYDFKAPGIYNIYARVFKNTKWWEIEIDISWKKYNIKTKTNSLNKFSWQYLWKYKTLRSWKRPVEIKNIEGFNWVNVIWFMPEEKLKEIERNYNESSLFKSKQISLFEGEKDFKINWNVLSNNININLSNWKSANVFDWSFSTNFNILKKWNYNIALNLNKLRTEPFYYEINIIKDSNLIKQFKDRTQSKKLDINLWHLDIWWYMLEIILQDKDGSEIDEWDLQRLDWINIEKDKVIQPQDETGCSYYEGLYNNKSRYLNYNNKKRIELYRWLSCFWLNTSHKKKIEVKPWQEYLISYILDKYDTKDLHSKLKFYNDKWENIKDIFLFNHEEFSDGKRRKFEKIITIPNKVSYFKIHFLQKQLQEFYKRSVVEISDLNVRNYDEMPGLDSAILYDKDSNLFSNNNYWIKIDVYDNKKFSKKINLRKDSANIKIKLEPLLWVNKTKINNIEIENSSIAYSWDITDLLSTSRELNIVSYSLSPYSLLLKDDKNRLSTIYFTGTFESDNDFLRFFLIENLGFLEEKTEEKLKTILDIDWKTLQLNETFTKFWQVNKGDIYIEPVIINLVSNGYVLKNSLGDEFEISYVPKKYVIIGYFISIWLFLVFVTVAIIRKRKKEI